MSVISINDMAFYAYHGCFEEERKIGTRFNVCVSLVVDTTKAQVSDCIEDTVNYLTVYTLVKKEMSKSSNLLEHVSDRIANVILSTFLAVEKVCVNVEKLNPPLGGQMRSVSVSIEKVREVNV